MTKQYAISLIFLAMLLGIFQKFIYNDIVHVENLSFHTDEANTCRQSDINVDRAFVRRFFKGAVAVSSRQIHDEYDLAPCFMQGTLVHGLQRCEWSLRPEGIGTLQCGAKMQYFVCEMCESAQ